MKMKYIKIGSIYEFEKKITFNDIINFANLTGDKNKIHIDKKYGEQSIFKNNIAHGMLIGSLFSTLIGMYCPGENSLYLSQSLNFKKPIFPNDNIIVRGTIVGKNESINVINIKTEILKYNQTIIDGIAKVKLI